MAQDAPQGPAGASKAWARARARDLRAAAFKACGPEAAQSLAETLFASPLADLIRPGVVVAGYMPIATEIDPRPLMEGCAARGARLCLPAIPAEPGPLCFRAWSPGDRLERGGFGTREPRRGAEDLVPAVVLVPLLAFDRRGGRLGYGQGHYDRTLAALAQAGPVTAIGLAFSAQDMENVPSEPHDVALPWIVTERAAIRCAP